MLLRRHEEKLQRSGEADEKCWSKSDFLAHLAWRHCRREDKEAGVALADLR